MYLCAIKILDLALVLINKASCGRTTRPNMKPALHGIPGRRQRSLLAMWFKLI
jgi:hypothetical protein